MRGIGGVKNGEMTNAFIVITTDEGLEGVHGPISYRAQLLVAVDGLKEHIVGRDPMENRLIWDIMSRFDRHARSGLMLMAISCVDIALWDLKGKILGQPVYKVLGGGRARVKPYISTLAFSVEPQKAKERALWLRDLGFGAQKWFFRYGPGDGIEGIHKNLELAFTLREALGKDYELMFDCWMGWTSPTRRPCCASLRPFAHVGEEVLRPHMQDGYRILKNEVNVPLSAGEHLYTRMEVNDYLKGGVFDVMQSDPEWWGASPRRCASAICASCTARGSSPTGTAFCPPCTSSPPCPRISAPTRSACSELCEQDALLQASDDAGRIPCAQRHARSRGGCGYGARYAGKGSHKL
jgi:L-alanine-DL-glutamate epimerase-like enolase superfamily enzyme